MNKVAIFILKALRKVYTKCFAPPLSQYDRGVSNPETASEMIYKLLVGDKPCMIARFGAFELSTILNCLAVNGQKHSVVNYIKGKEDAWWWNQSLILSMQQNAGFFPSLPNTISRFTELMLEDAKEVDLLGCWLPAEKQMESFMQKDYLRVSLLFLEPYWAKNPWSRALANKKVLVIHPFAPLIEQQYKEKRQLLFKNPDVLPEFELHTIQAVQSLGGESNGFASWFEALDWMKAEMDKVDYDICLIGCGAYGFPLAAHAKRMSKKSVHLGGALQLLFGIRGKRWEAPDYHPFLNYNDLMNEHWIRPTSILTPNTIQRVEGGCYW